GHPRAEAVIEALRDGRLYAWKWPRPDAPLYIRAEAGFLDARSGEPVATPAASNLRKVIVSDTIRAALEAAEDTLGLFADDAEKRRGAAEALFVAADPGALALIEKALAAEHDPAVARLLRQAHAVALLKPEQLAVSERLAAVRELAERG